LNIPRLIESTTGETLNIQRFFELMPRESWNIRRTYSWNIPRIGSSNIRRFPTFQISECVINLFLLVVLLTHVSCLTHTCNVICIHFCHHFKGSSWRCQPISSVYNTISLNYYLSISVQHGYYTEAPRSRRVVDNVYKSSGFVGVHGL